MNAVNKSQEIITAINAYIAIPTFKFLFFDIFAGARGKKSVNAMHDDLTELVNSWVEYDLTQQEKERQLKAFVKRHQDAFFGGKMRESNFEPVLKKLGYDDIIAEWNRDLEQKSASYQF
ncbi:MAG: hypothetical protein NTV32_00905 [Gammaproteobacteria bacterium]|nr:hypothetical protein [Gammaproteobacteria bacterium]